MYRRHEFTLIILAINCLLLYKLILFRSKIRCNMYNISINQQNPNNFWTNKRKRRKIKQITQSNCLNRFHFLLFDRGTGAITLKCSGSQNRRACCQWTRQKYPLISLASFNFTSTNNLCNRLSGRDAFALGSVGARTEVTQDEFSNKDKTQIIIIIK